MKEPLNRTRCEHLMRSDFHIPDVRVLCHYSERALVTLSPNDDGWMGPSDRLGIATSSGELVVGTNEGHLILRPKATDQVTGFLQSAIRSGGDGRGI